MFKDYKNYLRPFHLEETSDYLFFRPMAFLVLKVISRLPVTPNGISYGALVVSIGTGYFLAGQQYLYAGLGVLLFSILDCCDGMLARKLSREKGYSNPMGEIVDMFVDLLSAISFFVGLSIGMGKSEEWQQLIYLPYLSGAIIFIHATLFHFYKKQYAYYLEGGNIDEHIGKFKLLREEYRKSGKHKYDIMLISMFLMFSKVEQKKSCGITAYDKAIYIEKNKKILPLWAMIAGSNHLAVLGLSLIFNKLEIFFFYSIVVSNIWMAFSYGVQLLANWKCTLGSVK